MQKRWKALAAVLTVCIFASGCGSVQDDVSDSDTSRIETYDTTEGSTEGSIEESTEEVTDGETEDETDGQTTGEILGWQVSYGETFSDEQQINYTQVDFLDFQISVALPTALWDPDNFYDMSEEGGGSEALDMPVTDWTDDDMFCVVVPSTAFFSVIENEDTEGVETWKAMDDEEYLSKKLEGYTGITALDDEVQREETDEYYRTSIKVQVILSLYNRDFTFEGYWISVYRDGKVVEFSYGETRTEDGEIYDTAQVVLDSFEVK